MPWIDVFWTEENEAHLLEHGVSREEAEYVIRNPVEGDVSESSERPIALGYTTAGRRIAVVYEEVDAVTVYPITAYDLE